MKSILIPVNFSTRSNNAIDFTFQLTSILSAEITLLNVRGKIYKPLLEEISTKLSALKSSIEEETGLVINTDIHEGPVAESTV